MSILDHTPGPWRLATGNERHDLSRQFIWSDAETPEERNDGSDYCIATVNPRAVADTLDANALLIAAAPDLLQLGLQFASECGDCSGTRICPDGERCDQCDDIWAVLTKAGVPEPDNDPTPWCAGCGSMTQPGCDCGPIAENN